MSANRGSPRSLRNILLGFVVLTAGALVMLPAIFVSSPARNVHFIEDWQFNPVDPAQASAAQAYRIALQEDTLYTIYEERPFWDYNEEERAKLPRNLRGSYKVVVPAGTAGTELEATLKKFISDQRQANPDMDEIIVFVYAEGADIETPNSIARAVWAPFGELGNVTGHIATTNDRSDYKIGYQLRTGE